MIVSISQPTLFPWLGYFDIINKSDIFVFLNDAQLEKRSWQTRNRIKNTNSQNSVIWLNIPIKKTGLNTLIKDVIIDNSKDWKNHHIKTMEACYGQQVHNLEWVLGHYKKEWDNLADFNIEFIKQCCKFLGIKTKFELSSELKVKGKRTEKLANICSLLKGDLYLSTIGAKEYLNREKEFFEKKNIKIVYHEYNHPEYKQKDGNFISNLSILDLLLNLGDDAKKIYH